MRRPDDHPLHHPGTVMTTTRDWPLPLRQGKVWRLIWILTDSTGEPINLTGATVRAQMRRTWADDDDAGPVLDLSLGSGITVDLPTATITTTVPAATSATVPYGSWLVEWEVAIAGEPIDDLPVWQVEVLPEVVREVAA